MCLLWLTGKWRARPAELHVSGRPSPGLHDLFPLRELGAAPRHLFSVGGMGPPSRWTRVFCSARVSERPPAERERSVAHAGRMRCLTPTRHSPWLAKRVRAPRGLSFSRESRRARRRAAWIVPRPSVSAPGPAFRSRARIAFSSGRATWKTSGRPPQVLIAQIHPGRTSSVRTG